MDLGFAIKETPPKQQYMLMEGVSWQLYDAIGEVYRERAGIHLTYDRGTLEIMSLSFGHEKVKTMLGRLAEAVAEVYDFRTIGGGSTTFRREDLEKGLEPDECFYSKNFDAVATKDDIDLSIDPPPDLVIEVDVSSSSLDRMAIYAALGVPEVWRWEDDEVIAYSLRSGKYVAGKTSRRYAPGFPISELLPFLEVGQKRGLNAMTKEFRQYWSKKLAERN